jgi:uncharacterized protein involved in outer membrane biogenesis
MLLLLVLSAFIILRFYEDDVVKFAIDKTKSKFETRLEMSDVDLVFWQTFPKASLHFKDLYIEETFPEKDTLLYAQSLYLKFSLLDLFRGEYTIQSVELENAKCEMYRNIQGEDNWHFWKEDNSDTSQFHIALKEVRLVNTRLIYADYTDGLIMDFSAEESISEGNFSGEQFDLAVEMNGRIHHFESGDGSYAPNKSFELEATIDANTKLETYTFKQCEISIEKLAFTLDGFVNASEKSLVDIHVNGNDIELDELVESLSENQRKSFSQYDPEGEVDIDLSIKGETSGKKRPLIDVHAVMRDGSLKHRSSGTGLENLSCDLRYNSGSKSDELKISSFQCNLEDGFLKADGKINNLKNPELNINLEARMDMEGLRNFFALDTLEMCSGQLSANARIEGKLKFIEADSAYDWRSLLTSGTANLDNGLLRVKNSNREFADLNARIIFDRKDATIEKFSGKVNGSDFQLNGVLVNLIPYLSSTDEQLRLDANMKCQLIDFTNLVETESSSSTNNAYKFELPERIEFNLKTDVAKFIFRKFEATEIKGVATLNNNRLTIDPVTFRTADGVFTSQIVMERASENLYRLNCLAQLQSINIQKLFTEFENFNQEFIQDKHLKGIANSTVQFRTMLTTSLEVQMDKLESVIDISISNGELNNLESLQEIAAYIKKNKLVAPFVDEEKFAERMKNISFSKLENVIEIRDRLITVPLMDIRSSALDISAKGEHTFDNEIDYAIGFNLRDVLVKKQRDFQEEDDGLGKRLYVSMKGTTENPVFGIDRELAKEVRQEEMEVERQNVKALLKEEFGLFKRDNSVGSFKEETKTGSSTNTTLEWEESDQKKVEPKSEEQKKTNDVKQEESKDTAKKKKVPKWLEEKK